jgi:hypothetical protein
MLSTQVLQEAIALLQARTDLDANTKYLLLASFVMYFKSPLKSEAWNTFPSRVLKRQLTVSDALFTLDEEKNPDFWQNPTIPMKTKKNVQQQIFGLLWPLRDALLRKHYFPEVSRSVIAIPDPSAPAADPTLFPVEYLKKQVDQGNYVNELTGHPLSWTVVEQIRSSGSIAPSSPTGTRGMRTVAPDHILKGVRAEIEQLNAGYECCAVCRKRTRQFKTLHNYQTIYLCSLKCLSAWDPVSTA